MKLFSYSLIATIITLVSCHQLLFFDTIDPCSYKALPSLDNKYGYFIKNDSISISACISRDGIDFKEQGVYKYRLKMDLIIENRTKTDIELYTDSLKSICKSFDGLYVFNGYTKPLGSLIITSKQKNIRSEIYLYFDVKCNRNHFTSENDIEIDVPSLLVGGKRVALKSIILKSS